MATFTAHPDHAVNFGTFDIADLDGKYLYEASATAWRVGPFFVDTGSDRAGRVGIADNGAVVDVWIDTDGDDALDFKIAEIHTIDVIKVSEDITVAYSE